MGMFACNRFGLGGWAWGAWAYGLGLGGLGLGPWAWGLGLGHGLGAWAWGLGLGGLGLGLGWDGVAGLANLPQLLPEFFGKMASAFAGNGHALQTVIAKGAKGC